MFWNRPVPNKLYSIEGGKKKIFYYCRYLNEKKLFYSESNVSYGFFDNKYLKFRGF